MEKIFELIGPILEKATFKRVLSFGLLIAFGLAGYIGFKHASPLGEVLLGSVSYEHRLPTELTPAAEQKVAIFMKKHKEVIYLTVLQFQFEKNTRLPIHRSFNNDNLKKLIYERLNGGDGALPMFIKDDISNNTQVISILTGETRCDPFTGGGLARVWPDLANQLTLSCRVPMPPVFGESIRGYIVVHITRELSSFETEVLKLDLAILSKEIEDLIG